MTYSVSGLIQASDYNGFTGASAANVSGQLNTVLGVGKGNAGYGQTAVSNVAATTDTVTATQWTTLVNGVNTVRKHQSGAGFTNIGTYSAGTTINATNNISGNLTTAYTSRLVYTAQGATLTGSTFSPVFTLPNQLLGTTFQFTRTATFANADAARYFWNAGGQLALTFISGTNTGATTRGNDLIQMAVSNVAVKKVGGQDSVARTGTGGTVNTDLTTNSGYYTMTTANATITQITSGTYLYTSDTIKVYGKTNGVQGSNSDNGTIYSFGVDLTTANISRPSPVNDSINITLNHRVDVIYPSSTFLANTWGSVTIA